MNNELTHPCIGSSLAPAQTLCQILWNQVCHQAFWNRFCHQTFWYRSARDQIAANTAHRQPQVSPSSLASACVTQGVRSTNGVKHRCRYLQHSHLCLVSALPHGVLVSLVIEGQNIRIRAMSLWKRANKNWRLTKPKVFNVGYWW